MGIKPNDLQNAEKTPNVTSGRSGGVKPDENAKKGGKDNEYEPGLKQGQTEKEAQNGESSDRGKQMKGAININGGQQIDPAYREVGAGGEAGNKGNLGLEKAKGRDSKL
jgi:hypothetical protein